MKKGLLLLIAIFAIATTGLNAQIQYKGSKTTDKTSKEDYSFDKKTHNFKTVGQDKEVVAEFKVTNNHKSKDLILINVHPTCGCTVSEYPKEPIAPGKSATIKATFTGVVEGNFKKGIVIATNFSRKTDVLFLTGIVEVKKK